MTLDDMWKILLQRGGLPNEVLIDRAGTKLTADQAVKKDYQWEVIYFREDGYTIAADFYLVPYIKAAFPDAKWVGRIYRGWQKPKPLTVG